MRRLKQLVYITMPLQKENYGYTALCPGGSLIQSLTVKEPLVD